MTQNPKYRRRRKLIQPGLQLRLTLTFVGIAALSLLLQFVLFANAMTELAVGLPSDGAIVMERTGDMLTAVLGVSFLVFLPLTFAIGVLSTFRIAGPVYRFTSFLRQVQRGERPPDFRLRSGDELKELAQLINEVTAPLRTHPADRGASEPSTEPETEAEAEAGADPKSLVAEVHTESDRPEAEEHEAARREKASDSGR